MINLAICIASRGLVHSRTIESVLDNVRGATFPVKFFFTHDLPIPEAQNKLVKDALEWGADLLWFVEEDMFIPKETFQKMFVLDKEIVAVDYPVGEKRVGCIARKQGKILWCGLGCTLIRKSVFEKIGEPYFETHRSVRITKEDPFEYVIDEKVPFKYGGHDIMFGIRAREKGVDIYQLEGVTAGHIKPLKEGKEGSNSGAHQFEIWDKILQFQNYN